MTEVVVTYHGEEYSDYTVNECGDIYSLKSGKYLTANSDTTCPYPRVTLTKNGRPKKVLVHRVVAEAFVTLGCPQNSGISEEEWEQSPNSIKTFIMKNMIVNHIDHDKLNYSPDNLEWVTQEENAHARNKFYGI